MGKPFVFECSVCHEEKRAHVGRPRRVNGAPVCASCVGAPPPAPAASAPAPAPRSALSQIAGILLTYADLDAHEKRAFRGTSLALHGAH